MNRRSSVRARCMHTRIRRQWRDCVSPVLRRRDQQTTDFECTLIVRFPICTEMIQKRIIGIPVNYHQPTWYSPNVLTMATACSHLAAQCTAAKRMWRLFLNQRLGGSMDIYSMSFILLLLLLFLLFVYAYIILCHEMDLSKRAIIMV